MTLFSMASGKYLVGLFGSSVCWVYWFSVVNHSSYSILSSCGIAVFRILLTKYEIKNPMSPDKLMKIIFAVECVLYVPCVNPNYRGFLLSRIGLTDI